MKKLFTILFIIVWLNCFSQQPPTIGFNEIYKTTLSVSWTIPTNATAVEVQRATDRNFTSPTAIYNGIDSQLVYQQGLTQNTWYYYRARGIYGLTNSSWYVDSIKTFWTPLASDYGGNRIATSSDLSLDPFINVGDYIIVGSDSYPDGDIWGGGVGGYTGLVVPHLAHLNNKVCILGGRGYDYITLDMSLNNGTKDSLVVVTVVGGQVIGRLTLNNFKLCKFTGKYDAASKTGNSRYLGFDNLNWNKLEGSFGYFVRGRYDEPNYILSSLHGNSDSCVIEFIETGEGGYSGMTIKNDNDSVPMRGVTLRNIYTHDTGGEGYYIGSTQTYPQMPVIGFQMYNNVIARAGLNGLQIGQMKGASYLHNNTILQSGFQWNTSFMKFQDQAIQLDSRENGSVFRDNIIAGSAGQFLNWFMSPDLTFDNPTTSQTSITSHNLFTDTKTAQLGGYTTPRSGFHGTVQVDSSYWGGWARSNSSYRAIYNTDTGLQYQRFHAIESFAGFLTWNSSKNQMDNTIRSDVAFAASAGGTDVIVNSSNDTHLSTTVVRPIFRNYMDLDSSYDLSSIEQWVGAQCPQWNLYNRAGTQFEVIKNANATTSSTNISIPTIHPTTINATVGTGKAFQVGEKLVFTNGSNSFEGTIVSYNSGTGTVQLTSVSNIGTGTFNSWNVVQDIESIIINRIYNLNDIVRYNGRFYRSLENNNTNNQPTGNTDSHWKLIIFSNGKTYPPDDVRLYANGFYSSKGIGLTNNVPSKKGIVYF